MNSDFKDLLRILNEGACRYLVVGGYAVIRYTEPRYTKDIDILIDCTPENAQLVIKALRVFGAPLHDLTVSDLHTPGIFFQIGIAPNRIDIITQIPGVDFAQAFERRAVVDIEGVLIPFISREDLIASKLASGRPQDLVDAGSLAKGKG